MSPTIRSVSHNIPETVRGFLYVKKTLITAALVLSLSAVAVACDDGDDATPEPTEAPAAEMTEAPEATEAPAEEMTEAPAEVEEEIADEADLSEDEAAVIDEANDAEEAVEDAVEEEIAEEIAEESPEA